MDNQITLLQNAINNSLPNQSCLDYSIAISDDNESNWEQLFWSAKYLFTFLQEGSYDKLIIANLELSHQLGLTYKSNSELYLESARILAQLYFKYSSYKKANNYLLIVRELAADNRPDWSRIYYAKSLIHLEINSIILEPKYLFDLLSVNPETSITDQEIALIKTFLLEIPDKIDHKFLKDPLVTSNLLIKLHNYLSSHILLFDEELQKLTSFLFLEFPIDINSENYDPNFIYILKSSYSRLTSINEVYKDKLSEYKQLLDEQSLLISKFEDEKESLAETYRTQIDDLRNLALASDEKPITSKSLRVLVLGATQLHPNVIYGIAKNEGIEKDNIELLLDYDQNKRFDIEKLKYNSPFDGILVGPIAHKVIGLGDNTSVIEKLSNEEGYPPSIVMRTNSGELKITKQSFRDSLKKLMVLVQSNNPV